MMMAMHPLAHPLMHSAFDMILEPQAWPDASSRLTKNEDGSTYTLSLPAPGVAPQDIKVSVEGRTLVIEGESKRPGAQRSIRFSTQLPHDADADQAVASSINGLLQLTVPVKPELAPMRIEVNHTPADIASDDEDSDGYTLTLAAPGIAASDVEILAKDGLLQVTGETRRTGARVAKRVRLPRDADASAASATHVDGLLTVSVPKKSEAQVKKVLTVESVPAS